MYRDFLDIREHGFVRVAVVIPTVHVANPLKNAEAHVAALQKAYDEGVFYALCPELGLTAYTSGDLFHADPLLAESRLVLQKLVEASRRWQNMLFSVGLPLELDGAVYNCGVTIMRGRVLGVSAKSYPPEYREFYEGRHFGRAPELISKNIVLCGRSVPIGNDVLIRSEQNPDFILHTEICEDLWVPIAPSRHAALAGATVLANLSASNITIGKADYRQQLVETSSGACLAVQMYSAAGFGESTMDLSWDGDGYIAERGGLLARTERFRMDGTSITSDVNLRALKLDRMRQSSFRQNASDERKSFRTISFKEVGETKERTAKLRAFRRDIEPHPFVPKDRSRLHERCYETFNIQATALARRLQKLPAHMRRIFLGLSGGQDSTHAALVAVRALDLLKLPRTDLVCITMPGFGTTARTRGNAGKLAVALGATFLEMPIPMLALETFKSIGFDPESWKNSPASQAVYENVQALVRKHILFSASNQKGIVLGTGDLSELFLGWCTYGADQYAHYNVNADVPKSLISFLIAWTIDNVFRDEELVQEVLKDILATPISPELIPPDADGKIVQKSEETNGPYELHDFFGYWFHRFGIRPATIARMALHAFGGRYAIGEIKHWLKDVFLPKRFQNQFKITGTPPGPKVGLVALSPRGDWRMPDDADPDAWLRDAATIPDTLE
jgi:NAD+ synthase (glutamine-hydrolysing)